jgi:1-acyl-sn-glycerol-3-phosphate acyltransferase
MNPHHSLLFQTARVITRIILPTRFQVSLQGLEHLPETGPAVLIPKHQQWWDVPLLAAYLPRPLLFLAKKELFETPVSRFFISRFGGIAVDRGNPLKSLNTFRSLHPLLQHKAFLVLFPEGTYYWETMGPGKWRLVQMLLRLQQKQDLPPISFIPIGIRYSSPARGTNKQVEISLGPSLSESDPFQAESFTQALLCQVKMLSRL